MTESVANIYNSISYAFHTTRKCHWKGVAAFLDKLPKYALVSDCGTGNGKYINYRKDIQVIANDISTKLALIAKKYDNQIIIASCTSLPYRDKCFDYSISIAVLHHLDNMTDHIQFIKELIRITKHEILITIWALEQPVKKNWICAKPDGDKYKKHDYLIPWNLGNSKALRPYHLFSKAEVEEIMLILECKYELWYEKDNWFIIIKNL